MDATDLITDILDGLTLPWGSRVDGAPPSDVELFHIDNVLQLRRFVIANGEDFLKLCRVFVHNEDGRTRLSVEPMGTDSDLADHALRMMFEAKNGIAACVS